MQSLLAPLGHELLPQSDFDLSPADETGLTFIENAILKARHASASCSLPALADDSGLEVDALNGAPGVRSARFAGAQATDADNVSRLLQLLDGVAEDRRGARFRCVVAYLRHPEDATPLICQGRWDGRIAESPRGDRGFGYDPVFYDPHVGCTAAELEPEHKNRISHRGRALAKLKACLAQHG